MFTSWKTDHFLQNVFSFPKPWQHCALPSSGKNTVSHCFFVQASAPSWLASALPGWKFCFSPQMILIYATCILFFKPNSHWYSKEFNMSAEFRFNRLDSASLVYRKEFQYPNYISFWDSKLAYLMKANACTCAPVSINRDNIFAPFRFFIESYCRKENLQLISENNTFNWSKIFSRTFFAHLVLLIWIHDITQLIRSIYGRTKPKMFLIVRRIAIMGWKSKGIFANSEEQQQSKSGSKVILICTALMRRANKNIHKVLCMRFVPKVRWLPSKLSFLFLDFYGIRLNVTLISNKFFGMFNKAK